MNEVQQKVQEMDATRREFLRTTLAASVFALGSGGTMELLGEVLPDDFKERGSQTHGIYTLRFADFPALRMVGGSSDAIVIPGAPLSLGRIIVTRYQANTFSALNEECTHEGCPIGKYSPSSGLFTCSCHGAQYDATGVVRQRALNNTAQHGNLKSYPTTYKAGDDFVQIDIPGLTTSVRADAQYTSGLSQNFPNPANTTTVIEYTVAKETMVTIGIYSILGKELTQLIRKEHEAGQHRITADVSNFNKGVYFYRMDTTIGFSQTRKLTVI